MPASSPTPPTDPLPDHVLVVEDDAILAMAIGDILDRAGVARVEICATTDLALEAMRRERPDAIVLDVHLADRDDGWAIADMLRALGPDSPAIVFSTGSPDEIPQDIASLGPVLTKPYAPDALIAALRDPKPRGLLSRLRGKFL